MFEKEVTLVLAGSARPLAFFVRQPSSELGRRATILALCRSQEKESSSRTILL
jgi:hypothetical protein